MGHEAPRPSELQVWALLRQQRRLARRVDAIDDVLRDDERATLREELDDVERAVRREFMRARVR